MIPQIILWLCIAVVAFTYLGYPLVLMILGLVRGRPEMPAMTDWPRISVLMAVHNEAGRILDAIRKTTATPPTGSRSSSARTHRPTGQTASSSNSATRE